jgi:transposase
MKEFSKYIGLDVHKETIAVAVADGVTSEVRFVDEIVNTPEAINKLIKQLKVGDAVLKFCYEAGPCGYGIHRQLTYTDSNVRQSGSAFCGNGGTRVETKPPTNPVQIL